MGGWKLSAIKGVDLKEMRAYFLHLYGRQKKILTDQELIVYVHTPL